MEYLENERSTFAGVSTTRSAVPERTSASPSQSLVDAYDALFADAGWRLLRDQVAWIAAAACVQLRSGEDVAENIRDAEKLIRAAAKNHDDVAVVVEPADYAIVLDELARQS